MTPADLDLTEAVDAAARADYDDARTRAPEGHPHKHITWDDAPPMVRHGWRDAVLLQVTAAAPLIERAVRERVAADIEAAATRFPSSTLTVAAQIARTGEAPRPAGGWPL